MVASSSAPQLPGYRDLTPLGRGGYSEVYRAYQDQFDRWVAVKVLTFALTDDRAQRRFLRECRVAGRLSGHPNIVTVYDAGLSPDGRPYISMELFDQGSIGDRLRGVGPFDVADVLRIAVGLAGALETAHRAGVVHRDVKPANVLLASYGQPALTDFGLSILAERQEVSVAVDALTPYHAPPEVLERTSVTPTSDVYSLASTTYAMLAARAPHQRGGDQDTMASLLLRILQMDIPPIGRADVPATLDAALRAALARDAHERTSSALAFAQGMQQVQAELGLEVTQPIVMDSPQSNESAGHAGGAGLHEVSPGALTVPTDSPGPAVRPEATLGYGTAVPGEATINRPGAAGPGPGPGPAGPPPGPPGPPGPGQPPVDDSPSHAAPAPPGSGFGAPASGFATAFAPGAPSGPAPSGYPASAGPAASPGDPGAPAPSGFGSSGGPPPSEYPSDPSASGFGSSGGPPPSGYPSDPSAPGASGAPAPSGFPGGPAMPGPGRPDGAGPPPGQGWGGPLDGDATVHRDVVRRARPAEPPPKQSKLGRRLLVGFLVLALVGGGVGAYLATQGDDDSGGGRGDDDEQTQDDETTTTAGLNLPVPTGMTATESQAGVELRWDGDNGQRYIVLMMSTAAPPEFLQANLGAAQLVPAAALQPNVGYCFSVALLSSVQAAQGREAEVFSSPQCIRGASEDTVQTG